MTSLRRFLAIAILAISIGAPLAEAFDRWDRADGNETEISLVIVALCVAVALCATAVVVAAVRASAHSTASFVATAASAFATLLTVPATIPKSRPPTPLRI